ncbi:hypothetical protein HOD08_04110 [bacterium]|nr:hypothetical protein [bacterium]
MRYIIFTSILFFHISQISAGCFDRDPRRDNPLPREVVERGYEIDFTKVVTKKVNKPFRKCCVGSILSMLQPHANNLVNELSGNVKQKKRISCGITIHKRDVEWDDVCNFIPLRELVDLIEGDIASLRLRDWKSLTSDFGGSLVTGERMMPLAVYFAQQLSFEALSVVWEASVFCSGRTPRKGESKEQCKYNVWFVIGELAAQCPFLFEDGNFFSFVRAMFVVSFLLVREIMAFEVDSLDSHFSRTEELARYLTGNMKECKRNMLRDISMHGIYDHRNPIWMAPFDWVDCASKKAGSRSVVEYLKHKIRKHKILEIVFGEAYEARQHLDWTSRICLIRWEQILAELILCNGTNENREYVRTSIAWAREKIHRQHEKDKVLRENLDEANRLARAHKHKHRKIHPVF